MPFFALSLRSSPVGGAVLPGKLIAPGAALDRLRQCSNIVFMVHGFNVSQGSGIAELQALSLNLPAVAPEAAAVAVLWPGDSRVGPLSYPFETNNADDSATALATYIGDNLAQQPRISFVAHSLGCRVVMETVRQLWIKNIPVDQVCLMAAAIDNDSLAKSPYLPGTEFAARVGVLYSPSDQVLRFAYPAGNLLSAFLHFTATTDAALGYTGPRAASSPPGPVPEDVSVAGIPRDLHVDHGDYLPGDNGLLNVHQQAAARFVNSMLAGVLPLVYR